MISLLLSLALAAPTALHHQGRLLDAAGAPLSGPRTLTFRLYDDDDAGTLRHEEALTVPLADGYYAVSLGADGANPIDDADLDVPALWLEVEVQGAGSLGRTPIGSVPYARNGGGSHSAVAHAASAAVPASQARGAHTHTNAGATGPVTLTLPPAAAGLKLTVLRAAAHDVHVAPASGDTIAGLAGLDLLGPYASSTLVGVDGDTWVQVAGEGVSIADALRGGLTFTTCGNSGRFGPSSAQCASAYAEQPAITEHLTVGGGIQQWTVPVSGTYRIQAWGAEGGGRYYGGTHCTGGLGGYVSGDVALTAGTTLKILVGQRGGSVDDATTRAQGDGQGLNGSGGGGSFVATLANVPLLIAGGGGGRYPEHSTCSDATIHGGQTSFSGDGGGPQQDGDSGAGGGGFSADGSGNWGEQHNNDPGRAFLNGGRGGEANQGQVGGCCAYTHYSTVDAASGGFGGGGGARYWSSSGGGGGYHGGKGWNTISSGSSQSGGSSYVSGANTTSLAGQRTGHGQVIVQLL